ncbi:MAG: T9SS type A sorting domain-containing protein [Flavobacteriales bacterium]|nr:T9SS type A sorting domain-containing protein [Flavobacteriales bacterium]
MRLIIFILCSLVFTIQGMGQNVELVKNGGFENFDICPNPPGNGSFGNVVGSPNTLPWIFNPTTTTSDWYHRCMGGDAEITVNDFPPHSGNGFAGIMVTNGPKYTMQWREFVSGHLKCPLIAGQTYIISFWVKLWEESKWATDKIGMVVHGTPLPSSNTFIPHVTIPTSMQQTSFVNPWGNYITNEDTWVQFSKTIIAQGGERWFTIGNFGAIPGNYQVECNTGCFNPKMSYYFIDDVSVNGPSYDCQETVLIENTQYTTNSSTVETAGSFIEAGYNVGPPQPNGNVIAAPNSKVDYVAGYSIVLDPGFSATTGSRNYFQACIVPNICNPPPAATADAGPDIYLDCAGGAVTIGNDCSESSYEWVADPPSALAYLDNPFSCQPTVSLPNALWTQGIDSITYSLIVNQEWCDVNYDEMVLYLNPAIPPLADAGLDQFLNGPPTCLPYAQLGQDSEVGVSYSWSPSIFLDDPTISNPTCTYDPWLTYQNWPFPITYTMTATWDNGCGSATDQVVVDAYPDYFRFDLSTGYSNSSLLPLNQSNKIDDNWTYVSDEDGNTPNNPDLKIVDEIIHDLANDVWTGLDSDKSHWINPTGNLGKIFIDRGNYPYTFKRDFEITNLSEIQNVSLDVRGVAVDNVCIVKINGVEIYPGTQNLWPVPSPPINNPDNFKYLHGPYSKAVNPSILVQGTNSITVHIANSLSPTPSNYNSRIGLKMEARLSYKSCVGPLVFAPFGKNAGNNRRARIKKEELGLLAKVYPNPTFDKLNIALEGKALDEQATVEVYSLTGQLIHSVQTTEMQFSIDMSNYHSGIFLLRVQCPSGVYTQRIVKE